MKKYTLQKDFADKWLSALRSGKYKQAQEMLLKSNELNNDCSYCCLGVAAKICGYTNDQLIETGELIELTNSDLYDDYEDVINRGIPLSLIIGDLKSCLINLNDNKNLSFSEIADWIEENVELV